MPKIRFSALNPREGEKKPKARKRRRSRKARSYAETRKPRKRSGRPNNRVKRIKRNPPRVARARRHGAAAKVRRRNPKRRSPIDRMKATTIQATGVGGETFFYTGDRFDTDQSKAAKFYEPKAAMRAARDIKGVPPALRRSLRVVKP